MNFSNEKQRMATATLPPAFTVYNTVARQVEQAKLKVQEQTPVVSVLQPVQVPVDDEASGLNVLILFVTSFIFLSFVLIVVRYFLRNNNFVSG